MDYIENGVIKLNKTPVRLLFKIISIMLLLDIISIIILSIDYMNMISSDKHSFFGIEEYFFILVLFLQLIFIIIIFLKWTFKYFVLEKNKLTYYKGIIFKSKQEFVLNKIGCITFKQGILGKIFNYGDIFIYVQNEKFKLSGINSPNKFIKLIGNFKDN